MLLARHDDVTWADTFTAFGTVGAVVVALAIASWPWITRKFKRPKLKLVTGLAEPFLRPIRREKGIGFDELRLRVGIRNDGRGVAHGVAAMLLNWWEYSEKNCAWQELDADPLPMKWVSIRPADDRPNDPPTVSILSGCTEYLDIIIWRADHIELLVDDGRQTLFEPRRSPAIGKWRVQFALAGADCDVERYTVELECDGSNFVSRVEASTPPGTAQHVGLFHLLSGGQEAAVANDSTTEDAESNK